MSPELSEKLEESSNPNYSRLRSRRASTTATLTKAALSKRRGSVPNVKRQPMKKAAPTTSSITE